MSLFENYRQYAKDVVDAAHHMTAQGEVRMSKLLVGTAASVLVCGGAFSADTATLAHAEVKQAIESVSGELDSQPVEVQVEDENDTSVAALLNDRPNNLSAKDEAAIAESVRGSITAEALTNAAGKFDADGMLEVEISTEDDIPVLIKIKKTDDGGYAIEKIVAKLDSTTAEAKKAEVTSPITTTQQREASKYSLSAFKDVFNAIAGIPEDADEATRAAAYASNMTVLADNLLMTVPAGYAPQDAADIIADDAVPMAVAPENAPDEKKQADKVSPYLRTYKNDASSSISVRSENLGSAFTSINGLECANKLTGYWSETAANVATGANQHLKNEEEGFATQVFYDPESGMWGYFGHVVFTDDTRDVIYNRVVFVDELADQMITVSYRHDCASGADSAMTLDDFKKMFCHAPVSPDEQGAGGDDSVAIETYRALLREIQVLPGQTLTEPAREAAEKAAAEEAAAKAQQDAQAQENIEQASADVPAEE